MINQTPRLLAIRSGKALPLNQIPILNGEDFRQEVLTAVAQGWRVCALFGKAVDDSPAIELWVVIADDRQNQLYVGRQEAVVESFVSLSAECPQLQLFEREIAEQYGVVPLGHPWLKPVRYHHSWTKRDAWHRSADHPIMPGVGDFYRVDGEQVHEVAVGPVHAGIIEPGHFRFQCHGEMVYHLEIALGYQHRGVEQALNSGPDKRSLHLAETLAGDSTVAHAITYCRIVESMTGCQISARAQVLRGIALELERLANHVGDLGAISGDVGFLPTASYCGRIRGDFLNMTALLCGNRFGRGMIIPGGVAFDADETRCQELLKRLAVAEKESAGAINLLWENQSVMARLEDTGRLTKETAIELGLVGPAARATGLARDVRFNHPSGIYRMAQIPISTCDSGDAFARAYVRWMEIQQSIIFIRDQLSTMPSGVIRTGHDGMMPDSMSVVLTEGWRGEVCHVALTGLTGQFRRYKVVDPSFHNWNGLSMAMRGQEISDFPLCNKSFNLSYCGHDL